MFDWIQHNRLYFSIQPEITIEFSSAPTHSHNIQIDLKSLLFRCDLFTLIQINVSFENGKYFH